ncbi:hypothetical protein Tco_0513231 [Tanacetum coccineum]
MAYRSSDTTTALIFLARMEKITKYECKVESEMLNLFKINVKLFTYDTPLGTIYDEFCQNWWETKEEEELTNQERFDDHKPKEDDDNDTGDLDDYLVQNDAPYYVDKEEESFKERRSKLLEMPYEKPPTFKSERFEFIIVLSVPYAGGAGVTVKDIIPVDEVLTVKSDDVLAGTASNLAASNVPASDPSTLVTPHQAHSNDFFVSNIPSPWEFLAFLVPELDMAAVSLSSKGPDFTNKRTLSFLFLSIMQHLGDDILILTGMTASVPYVNENEVFLLLDLIMV